MAGVFTAAADQVLVDWGGHIVTGTMKGSFVEAARNSQSISLTIGSDGEGARMGSADKSGTVKVTLMQTSASNDVFSSRQQTDEMSRTGGYPLMVKDLLGRTVISASNAWLQKAADATFSDEIEGREWTLETHNLQMNLAGN